MKVRSQIFDKYVLSKFAKVSKLALSYATDAPIWSSIFFEKEKQRILYVGWNFHVEVEYPVEEDFVVNFERFRRAIKACKNPTIRVTKHRVIVKEKNLEIKLKRLDFDYSNYTFPEPENLEHVEVEEGLLAHINFCSLAATQDRMEYAKYGVIIGDEMICGMDSLNVVAAVFLESPVLTESVLLHLPWCHILQDLGEIKTIACHSIGEQNVMLFISTKDNFKLTVPALKVTPNPSIIPYLRSLNKHTTLHIEDTNIFKKLEITADTAYKYITAYSEGGRIYLETISKVKGKTTLDLCEGDLGERSVSLSLQHLKSVAKDHEYIYLDLDNMVAFGEIPIVDSIFAFSLG